jgi:purine-nucleoside phosphorylase
MRVLGVSIITDHCVADTLEPVNVQQIIATAMEAEPGLTRLIERVLERLPR